MSTILVAYLTMNKRTQEMVRLRTRERWTLERIGTRFGISRQRVEQILKKVGIKATRSRPCLTEGCGRSTVNPNRRCSLCSTRWVRTGTYDRPRRFGPDDLCPECQARPARPFVGTCISCDHRLKYNADPFYRGMRRRGNENWRTSGQPVRTPRDPARSARIRAWLAQGLPLREIARREGICPQVVAYYRDRHPG